MLLRPKSLHAVQLRWIFWSSDLITHTPKNLNPDLQLWILDERKEVLAAPMYNYLSPLTIPWIQKMKAKRLYPSIALGRSGGPPFHRLLILPTPGSLWEGLCAVRSPA